MSEAKNRDTSDATEVPSDATEVPSEAFLSGFNAGRNGTKDYDVHQAWATYLRFGGQRTNSDPPITSARFGKGPCPNSNSFGHSGAFSGQGCDGCDAAARRDFEKHIGPLPVSTSTTAYPRCSHCGVLIKSFSERCSNGGYCVPIPPAEGVPWTDDQARRYGEIPAHLCNPEPVTSDAQSLTVHERAFKRATECGIRWGFGETRIAALTGELEGFHAECVAAEPARSTGYPIPDAFDAKCKTCGKPPGVHCRAHYVARIAELETALKRIAEGDAGDSQVFEWPEFYASIKNEAREALATQKRSDVETVECPHCRKLDHEVNHPPGMTFVGMGQGWQTCIHCNGTARVPRTDSATKVGGDHG